MVKQKIDEYDDAITAGAAMCDAALPFNEARALAVSRMKIHPMFDIDLAKQLTPDMTFSSADAQRALEILDVISPGNRLVITLSNLMRSTDEKLRSKAALFLGKRINNLDWTHKYVCEADSRVRANIIEALWSASGADVLHIFQQAVLDRNPRVAANAAIGLYKREPAAGATALAQLADHADARFRCSALWAMGSTGSRSFFEELRRCLVDVNPLIRGAALKGLIGLKKASSSAAC